MPNRKMAAFRLPTQTIAELDLLVAALQQRSPGKVSQADAIAWAVGRVLAELTERTAKAAAQESALAKPVQGSERPLERDDGDDDRPVPLAARGVAGIGGPLAQEADILAEGAEMAAQRELHDRLANQAKLDAMLSHRREPTPLSGKAVAPAASTPPAVDGEPGAGTPPTTP
jgi:hypothetical protein